MMNTINKKELEKLTLDKENFGHVNYTLEEDYGDNDKLLKIEFLEGPLKGKTFGCDLFIVV